MHGVNLGAADSLAQPCSHGAMATKAEGADVIEVALATALRHGKNVIGVPKTFTHPFDESPMLHKDDTSVASRSLQPAVLPDRIQSAVGAHASVTLQNLFAQVSWLRPQFPLMYAKIRAEGEAARRHLERAPPAQAAPVRAAWDIFAVDPSSSWHDSRSAHMLVLNSPAVSA
jgi:hypothetical protein